MENLNTEEIINGLLQNDSTYVEDMECIRKAIRLIKELTEENERLTGICESYALQYGTATDKEVFLKRERADTAREMQERLNERIKDQLAYHGWYLKKTVLSSIVDEILNKNTEE